jgi:hypothetical protein
MKRLDFLATERQYIDHVMPLWLKLPKDIKGNFYTSPLQLEYAQSFYSGVKLKKARPVKPNLTLVASYGDLILSRHNRSRNILIQHGVGQSFNEDESGSYIGAEDRRNVVAEIIPGDHQAIKHINTHPAIEAIVTGCPKLDQYHINRDERNKKIDKKTIAISFHWDCQVCPEAGSAFYHYSVALPELIKNLKADGYHVLGHGHPRDWEMLKKFWSDNGAEPVKNFDEVMERAWLYVNDCSSTLFEWISLGRPVTVLNSPEFRRDVDHGMRFWEFADMGVQCDNKRQLEEAVRESLEDTKELKNRRKEITKKVYKYHNGESTEKTVEALIKLNDQWGYDY